MHAKLRVPLWKRGLVNETGLKTWRVTSFEIKGYWVSRGYWVVHCVVVVVVRYYPYLIPSFASFKIVNFGFKSRFRYRLLTQSVHSLFFLMKINACNRLEMVSRNFREEYRGSDGWYRDATRAGWRDSNRKSLPQKWHDRIRHRGERATNDQYEHSVS